MNIIWGVIGLMAFVAFVYVVLSLCLPKADDYGEDIIYVDENNVPYEIVDYTNGMEGCHYVDLDQTVDVIEGHGKLELIPGKEYDIHYGVHQGRHVYVGRKMDDNDLPEDYRAYHMFRPVDSNKITFSYYGHTSPYEFTLIVRPV